eukprot:TRINITY_DN1397_c0_g1_i2.p1 TRINITY_DN1397_c0_g1~~TRINITY_DN1397_c0_g1_i2.p1  ORF type:complete len:623 (-),score=198.85 TRINITY_DN1397_c0_g1_i2:13-1881(-)
MDAMPSHRPRHESATSVVAKRERHAQMAQSEYEAGLEKANQESAIEAELRTQEKGGQSFEARANQILQRDMATQAKRSEDEELDERIARMTKGPKPRFPMAPRKHVIAPPEVRRSGGKPNKKEVPLAVQNALRLQRIEETKSDLMRLQSALSATFIRYKRLVGDLLEHNPDGKTLTLSQKKVQELEVVDVEEIAAQRLPGAENLSAPGSRPTSVKRVRAGRRSSEVINTMTVRRGSLPASQSGHRGSVSSEVEQSVTTTTTTTTVMKTRVSSPSVSLADLDRFSPGGSRLGTPPRTPNRVSPTKAFSGDPKQFAERSMEDEILMLRVLLERERLEHEKTKEHLRKEANERRLAKLTMETTKLVGNVLLDMHGPIQNQVNNSTLPQITGSKPYHTVGVRPMGGGRLSFAPMPPPQIIDDDMEERYMISNGTVNASATSAMTTTSSTTVTTKNNGDIGTSSDSGVVEVKDVMQGSVLGRGNKTRMGNTVVAPKAFAPVIPADMPEVRNAILVEQQQKEEKEKEVDRKGSSRTAGRRRKKKAPSGVKIEGDKKPQPPNSGSKKDKARPLGASSVRFDLPGDGISPWGDGTTGSGTGASSLGKKKPRKKAKGAFAKQEHVRQKMFG